jgi:hypothetical protein
VYLCNYHNSGHIHRPVFYLKQDISGTEFCLRLQLEPTRLGPLNRASLFLSRAGLVSPNDKIQSRKQPVLSGRQNDE